MSTETPNVPRWSVQSQMPRTRANASGQITEGYDINFVTRQGHSGTVFVTDTQYRDPSVVSQLVDAAARNMDAVGQLTSED